MASSSNTAVAIIGAGPYGLSIATYLRSENLDFRIFGTPMFRWQAHMPEGMFLKSEGCASNLFDPTGACTLRRYCAEHGLPYSQIGAPIALKDFTQYGLSFQRRLVPEVENSMVTALDRTGATFQLQLSSGQRLRAGKVVVATGVSHSEYIPAALAKLPKDLLSHSGSHHDLSEFTGRQVTVIGGGQSALETAALLHESAADVRLIARRSSILWNGDPRGHRSVWEQLRRPMSNLGPGLGPWLYSNAPMLFCYLPQRIRVARVRKALGPAGAWWLRDRFIGRVPVMPGHFVRGAETRGERALLHLQGPDGKLQQVTTDHVIAATGYRFALGSLPFLSEPLRSQLCSLHQTPVLSPNFESCVPGLYFVGLASADQFGPAMRFLHGADYTARRVSGHIAKGHRFALPLFVAPSRAEHCEGL